MRESLRLSIPEPCHEDWAKMLPEEKGRHCRQCCKRVVDFTAMSDAEVVRFFKDRVRMGADRGPGATGVCGRFVADQFGRELAPAPVQRNGLKGWPLVVAGALTFGRGSIAGRRVAVTTGKTLLTPISPSDSAEMAPDTSQAVVPVVIDTPPMVPGTVTSAIEVGDVIMQGEPDIDLIGKIGIDSPVIERPADTVTAVQGPKRSDASNSGHTFFMGKAAACKSNPVDTLAGIDALVDTIANIVKDSVAAVVQSFKPVVAVRGTDELSVYPNPVIRGGSLRLAWRGEAGSYIVALLSVGGQVVQERRIEVGGKGQMDECPLPGGLAAGIPGNAGDLPENECFDTFLEQACCLLGMETNVRSSDSPFHIRLGDRLTGQPVAVDLDDEPRRQGSIQNGNLFVLAGSGGGKSFFMNHLCRTYHELGMHIVIVDVGHSYRGLCDLVGGYYFTYKETRPMQFNPFLPGHGGGRRYRKEGESQVAADGALEAIRRGAVSERVCGGVKCLARLLRLAA